MRHDLHSTCNGCIDSEMRSIRDLTLIKLVKNEPNGHTRVIIGCLPACEPMNSKITYSNGRHPLTPHDSTVQASLVAPSVYTVASFFVRKLQAREKVTL